MSGHIAKNILRLDISMADALCMNVSNGPHELVRVQFDDNIWDLLLHLVVLLHHSVGSVRNVVHHNIQVHLIWLLSVRIERLSHLDAIRMMQHFQNGQLSILVPLVLEHLLDGYCLSGLSDSRLENDTKRPISDNLLCVVGHTLLLLTSLSLIVLFTFHIYSYVLLYSIE